MPARCDLSNSFGVLRRGAENPAHRAKEGLPEPSGGLVAAVGPVRETGVDQEHRNVSGTGLPEMLRPDFALHQEAQVGLETIPCPADRRIKINGKVADEIGGQDFFASEAEASVGGGGQDQAGGWPGRPQFPQDRLDGEHLADADGLEPDGRRMGGGIGRARCESEPVGKPFAISAAPEAVAYIKREGYEDKNREREAVEPDHGRARGFYRCAPD